MQIGYAPRGFYRTSGVSPRAVFDAWANIPDGHAMAAQLVGHQNARHAPSLHQFLQKTSCSLSIPATLHQDFQHITLHIDGSPEPVFLAPDRGHDFVEVPFVGRCWTVASDFGGNLRSEPFAPNPDAFIGDDHFPLSQQILDITQVKRYLIFFAATRWP